MAGSLKKLAEKIKNDNDRFISLSKAEKRVEIARDCIERINIKQLNISQGHLLDFDHYMKDGFEEKSIKDVLNTKKLPECNVCAKGGLFMSYVGRVNECTFEDIDNDSYLNSYEMRKLQEIFEPMQLDLIELAFESEDICSEDFYELDDEIKLRQAAIDYSENLANPNSDDLLKSICKNIIKNKGEFIPTDIVSPQERIK